jgi:replicative DNA helicase
MMDKAAGRIPPQNIEAEQAVLGCMLLDQSAVYTAVNILKDTDFYRKDHGEIFNAMLSLFMESQPIDVITVADRLKARGIQKETGGIEYLATLVNMVETSANAEYYARIVEKCSILRKIITVCVKNANLAYEETEDYSSILDALQQDVLSISMGRESGSVVHIRSVLNSTMDMLDMLSRNEGEVSGIPTGFTDLDNCLNGLHNSDLILVAGRPGSGKSSFALNIGQYAAIHKNKSTVVFSLEMSREQLVNRIISTEIHLDNKKLKTGNLSKADWSNMITLMGKLAETPLYIDDTAGITVNEIKAKCTRLKAQGKLDLVLIDYLQLITGPKRDNRQQEISEISRALKIMAKDLNVPVITLSQLSRAPETRADHRPMLSDLRDSGAIEQDADIVLFLYRDDYYNKEKSQEPNVAECIIAKHRNGETGTVKLRWFGEYTKFANLGDRFQ